MATPITQTGVDGANGATVSSPNAGAGGNGNAGGALSYDHTGSDSITVTLKGGKGGKGGNARSSNTTTPYAGGDGGAGGATAIRANNIIFLPPDGALTLTLSATGGSGGEGGEGSQFAGAGGNGADGGAALVQVQNNIVNIGLAVNIIAMATSGIPGLKGHDYADSGYGNGSGSAQAEITDNQISGGSVSLTTQASTRLANAPDPYIPSYSNILNNTIQSAGHASLHADGGQVRIEGNSVTQGGGNDNFVLQIGLFGSSNRIAGETVSVAGNTFDGGDGVDTFTLLGMDNVANAGSAAWGPLVTINLASRTMTLNGAANTIRNFENVTAQIDGIPIALIGDDADNGFSLSSGGTIDGGGGTDTATFSDIGFYSVVRTGLKTTVTYTFGGANVPAVLTNVERINFGGDVFNSAGFAPSANFNGLEKLTLTTGGWFSDIAWQNDDGQVAVWTMRGLTQTGGATIGGNPGPDWRLKSSGDFNGDGKSDLLWQNASGQAAIWTMSGFTQLAGATIGGNPGSDWHVKGAGDFDGDGKADILWQNDDGQAAIWTMDGFTQTGGAQVGGNPGSSWHVIAAADFDGDGKADILWQNDDGQAAIWLMDGLSQTGGAIVGGNPGPTWHVKGAGDFDGDGKADILWQNDDGQAAVWTMDGLNQTGGAQVGGNPGSDWHVKGSGDFNGDGKADILWQNDNGQVAVWTMNGLTQTGGAQVGGNPGSSWHAVSG